MSFELPDELVPPMANGELAFEEPWQGCVFGIANSLCSEGYYEWAEFQAELFRVIGDWDRHTEAEDD
ncbi:MAG: hypothetical protein QF921_13370 [Pseudomonadales bacterium]|nr:hypothetical protein [Pseudomonadales bacterium]MDP6470314.1 hypothetical protein [Pseudomonadales bacterium]MDP6827220.1 hypothetical protein [Pseudomonadales bacterium]MDP6972477.1 hypothetical protein [Pseudomonadales bacterium]